MKPKEYKSPLIEKLLDEVTPEELERADNQMSKKQTAVEWLTEKLKKEFGFAFSNNILQQAKEMEQEQIQDAYYVGDKNGCGCYDYCTKEDAKDYYNENYENNRF